MPCQVFEGPKNRRVFREVGSADAGEQGVDKAPCSCDGGRPLALFKGATGRADPGGGDDHSPAEAPSKQRLAQQVDEADLDISVETLGQVVDVASEDVAAIPHISRLVPSEK